MSVHGNAPATPPGQSGARLRGTPPGQAHKAAVLTDPGKGLTRAAAKSARVKSWAGQAVPGAAAGSAADTARQQRVETALAYNPGLGG